MADKTTVQVYRSDAKKLIEAKLAMQHERGTELTLADVIHELIESAEARRNG